MDDRIELAKFMDWWYESGERGGRWWHKSKSGKKISVAKEPPDPFTKYKDDDAVRAFMAKHRDWVEFKKILVEMGRTCEADYRLGDNARALQMMIRRRNK